ncbi:DNA helicase [Malassezia obtusa]|uniref:DNA helicase n=1 Tax=Malassezia obtusa TaxID=76774 RepID=A0AAF0ISQ5_9BASI|nr:DNA helicase [Malassezia obtusa]
MPPDAPDLLSALFAGQACPPPKQAAAKADTHKSRAPRALGDKTNGAATRPAPAWHAAPSGRVAGYALADDSPGALAARRASAQATRRYTRAVVTHVYEREATNAHGRRTPEKVLELTLESGVTPPSTDAWPDASLFYQSEQHTGAVRGVAVLRDEWLATPVEAGDTVHLLGTWTAMPYAPPAEPFVDAQDTPSAAPAAVGGDDGDDDDLWDGLDEHVFDAVPEMLPTMVLASFGRDDAPECRHLLVLHPDVIVSASDLASVASCMRRPMLQERIKTASSTTYAAVFGNMVHGLLQACLVAPHAEPAVSSGPPAWARLGNFAPAFVDAEIERQLARHRGPLAIVEAETPRVRAELAAVVPALVAFAEQYLARRDAPPEAPCAVEDRRVAHTVGVRVTRVLGVEDDIVSPMYGLKGRVDVCVEGVVAEAGRERLAVLPLEVKTGRALTSVEHAAQTSLYTLLLSDHYGVPVDAGLLLYTQTGQVSRVHRALREVRSLLLARNEMATYKTRLPELGLDGPTSDAAASGDAASDAATSDAAASDAANGAPRDAPRGPPGGAALLPPTIDSAYKCARCYARDACMLYRTAVEHVHDTDSPIAALYASHTAALTDADRAFFRHWDALLTHEERSLARFRRELWTWPAAERERHGRCVTGLRRAADATFVQADAARPLHAALAVDDAVVLSAGAPHAAFLARGRVASVSATRVALALDAGWDAALAQVQQATGAAVRTFRVDVDELSSMLSVPRYNVACLFFPDAPPRVAQLRARVVHLAPPRWSALDARVAALVPQYTAACNGEQVAAIRRALGARDYALVHGMPGTGKSTTLAALVRILVAAGQSVLLCSHTHSAVDTVVAKLGGAVDVLRVGAPGRVHPRVRPCTLDARLGREAPAEALAALVARAPVVAATCLATNDAVFQLRTFDVCIVDEASQITLPTCLGPLRLADRFVMVGDPCQLAPLVRADAAAAGGLHTSLFERLSRAHPAALVALTQQYRMCAAIMALSNALVYAGRLRCGSDAVAHAALATTAAEAAPPWAAPLLAPDVRAALVDTDALGAHETRRDGALENATEAALAGALCAAFVQAGVAPDDIGVLTPYRQQVRLLRAAAPDAEVLTIDQAQGRDWPLVLVSMVRANDAHAAGSLLRDTRRLNVMLTRAKHKLLVLGSAHTLGGGARDTQRPLARVVDLLRAAHAVIPAPAEALPAAAAAAAAAAPAEARPAAAAAAAARIPTKTSPSKPRAIKSARGTHGVAAEVLAEYDL